MTARMVTSVALYLTLVDDVQPLRGVSEPSAFLTMGDLGTTLRRSFRLLGMTGVPGRMLRIAESRILDIRGDQ